jgi:hypothetical protein
MLDRQGVSLWTEFSCLCIGLSGGLLWIRL